MNNKPIFWRTVVAAVVILIFAISTHPLAERDFYDTFSSLVAKDNVAEADKLIETAKAAQAKDKELYPSQALLEAADNDGVKLKELIQDDKADTDNSDVIGLVRELASSSIRLGLDLAGGVEYIIELIPDADNPEQKEAAERDFDSHRDQAIETLRKRLEANKIYEAEITPTGDKFITIKAPIVSKDEKLKLRKLIEMSAKLEFRLVHVNNNVEIAQYHANPEEYIAPIGYEVMKEESVKEGEAPNYYLVAIRREMGGENIIDARPMRSNLGQKEISLTFDGTGAEKFAEVTGKNTGRLLAIVLDGKLYCAPRLNEQIVGGQASISGSFSNEELRLISDALRAGNFPYKIEIDAVFDTDPKLGAESVKNGIYAGIAALVVVVIFMMIYYKTAGVISVVALAVNVILVLGALSAFDATLTLPGIAGIILTIGMAVDANVLIFERIREEIAAGKSLSSAINLGYDKAFSAVLDANVTTLFIAIILMNVGTGPVKGFAVTLGIGIITSLFTALYLTRLMFDYAMRFFSLKMLTMRQFISNMKFDFLIHARRVAIISGVLIVVSFVTFAVKGKNMLSVDFTGGTLISFTYTDQVSARDIEKALADNSGLQAQVSYKSSASAEDNKRLEILIRENDGQTIDISKIEKDLNSSFAKLQLKDANETSVGGLIGWEFSKSALWAIFLSFLGIIIYVSLRYEFSYAMAGVVALVHDIIIASGIFALMGREFSLSVIAALLTIIGYSINDTVVIFDRIRENVGLHPELRYKDVVNLSINDTLNRTILTSLTTLFVVVVLFFFGGVAINDFVLVMLLGIIIGTYSSVCIASPIVSIWHKKIGGK